MTSNFTTPATPESLLGPTIHAHDESLLRLPEVEAVVGMKKSKIYSLLQEGQFPAPVRLGPRSVRWKSTDVEAWIDGLEGDPTGQEG